MRNLLIRILAILFYPFVWLSRYVGPAIEKAESWMTKS